MDAILLVGGFGTRLMPLTKTLPKPLIPLANVPFVERTIGWLRDAGIDNVILSLHYNAAQFMDYFATRALGVNITFALEETPLGTGGAIKNCEPHLRSDRCVICNGDIFTNLSLPAMLREHIQAEAAVSIALTGVDDPSRFGVIETDSRQRVLAFTEKPPRELARSREINAGIYLFEREMFSRFPTEPCSVERDIFPRLLEQDVSLFGYRESFYWTDLGTPRDYLQAHQDILSRRVSVPLDAREVTPGIWHGEEVSIAASALLRPPVLLGNGVRIATGAVVGPGVVLGDGAAVESHALIEHSVIWEHSLIRSGSLVRMSVLGRGARADGQVQDALCEDGGLLEGSRA